MQALGELISPENDNTMNSWPKGRSWFLDFTLLLTVRQEEWSPRVRYIISELNINIFK